jgi:hypothetical protein
MLSLRALRAKLRRELSGSERKPTRPAADVKPAMSMATVTTDASKWRRYIVQRGRGRARETAGVDELVTLITELQPVAGGPSCSQGRHTEVKERFEER